MWFINGRAIRFAGQRGGTYRSHWAIRWINYDDIVMAAVAVVRVAIAPVDSLYRPRDMRVVCTAAGT